MDDIEVSSNVKKEVNKEKWRMMLWVALIGTISIISVAIGIIISALGTYAGIGIILVTSIILDIVCVFKYKKVKKNYKGLGIQKLYSKKLWKWAYLRAPVIIIIIFTLIGTAVSFIVTKNSNSAVTAFILNNITKKIEDKLNPDDPWGDPPGEDPEDPYDPTVPIYEDIYEGDILVKLALEEADRFIEAYNKDGARGAGLIREEYWNAIGIIDDPRYPYQSYGVYKGNYGFQWCATFVGYMFYKAGDYIESHSEYSGLLRSDGRSFFNKFMKPDGINAIHFPGCNFWYYEFRDRYGTSFHNNINEYTPRPGDIVLYNDGTDTYPDYGHIGIVEKMEGDLIYTIEGNIGIPGMVSHTLYTDSRGSCAGRCPEPIKIAADGTFYKNSGRGIHIYHPDYETLKIKVEPTDPTDPTDPLGPSKGFERFNADIYSKGSNGYYDTQTILDMIYDFCIVELEMSPESACGFTANTFIESGGCYDQLEGGYGYVVCKTTGDKFLTPPIFGNANYKGVDDIVNSVWNKANSWDKNKYYYTSAGNVFGFGYGIVQWSFGRRVELLKTMETLGVKFNPNGTPDSFIPMLLYTKIELTDAGEYKFKFVLDKLLAIENGSGTQGAYDAGVIVSKNYESGYNFVVDSNGIKHYQLREMLSACFYDGTYKDTPQAKISGGDKYAGRYGNRTPLQYTIKPKRSDSKIFLHDTVPYDYEFYVGLYRENGDHVKQIDIKSDLYTKTNQFTVDHDYPYYIYIPKIKDGGKEYDGSFPLIIYLAGGGGSVYQGEPIKNCMAQIDGEGQYEEWGIPYYIKQDGVRPNAIVVAPVSNGWWGTTYKGDDGEYHFHGFNGNGDHREAEGTARLMEFIKYITQNYNIDLKRIYITGVSRGGCGTWSMLTHYPDFFAAALPLASAVSTGSNAVNTTTIIRLYQGISDTMGNSIFYMKPQINAKGGSCEMIIMNNVAHGGNFIYKNQGTWENQGGQAYYINDESSNFIYTHGYYRNEDKANLVKEAYALDWLLSQVKGQPAYDPYAKEHIDWGTFNKVTFIGDSNTVRMWYNTEAIKDAKHVLAVVGASVGNYKQDSVFKNSDDATPEVYSNGNNLYAAIQSLSSTDLRYVGILLGTNDYGSSSDKFKENYKKLLDDIYNKNHDAVVTIFTILPVNESTYPSMTNKGVDSINQYIKEISKEYTKLDIRVVDLNSKIDVSDMSTIDKDGVHLGTGITKCANIIAGSWN